MGKCMWRSFGEGGGFSEVGEGRGFGGVSCLKTPAFRRFLGVSGRIGSRKAQRTLAGFDVVIIVENDIFGYSVFDALSSCVSSWRMYFSCSKHSNRFDS